MSASGYPVGLCTPGGEGGRKRKAGSSLPVKAQITLERWWNAAKGDQTFAKRTLNLIRVSSVRCGFGFGFGCVDPIASLASLDGVHALEDNPSLLNSFD